MGFINSIQRFYFLLRYMYSDIHNLSEQDIKIRREAMAFSSNSRKMFNPLKIIDYKYLLVYEKYGTVNDFLEAMRFYNFNKHSILDKLYYKILKRRIGV